MKTATVFIVSAPSGTGKTSLVNALIKELDNIVVSVSYTTRSMRNLESNGQDYYFVDDQVFKQMIEQDAFLEYANVFGNWYGTAQSALNDALARGNDVVLEIDTQGAALIRNKLTANVVSIYILPPSLAMLQQRLANRQQDSTEVIARRMAQAKADIAHYKEYDYVIINDSFTAATADLIAIVRASRLSIAAHAQQLPRLIQQLLE